MGELYTGVLMSLLYYSLNIIVHMINVYFLHEDPHGNPNYNRKCGMDSEQDGDELKV